MSALHPKSHLTPSWRSVIKSSGIQENVAQGSLEYALDVIAKVLLTALSMVLSNALMLKRQFLRVCTLRIAQYRSIGFNSLWNFGRKRDKWPASWMILKRAVLSCCMMEVLLMLQCSRQQVAEWTNSSSSSSSRSPTPPSISKSSSWIDSGTVRTTAHLD